MIQFLLKQFHAFRLKFRVFLSSFTVYVLKGHIFFGKYFHICSVFALKTATDLLLIELPKAAGSSMGGIVEELLQ